MSLLGTGVVAIWHDIEPEGREEFYAWHGREHMPERVNIPGFSRGRRYVAINADLEFFNLYEARAPEVLTGSDYLDRLNDPTPWTLSSVKHFRDVARSICRVAATVGESQGGLVATWRYDVPDENSAEHIEAVTQDILPKILKQRGIAAAHLLIANVEASDFDTEERKARTERNQIPRWIVIVEGWGDEAAFVEQCGTILTDETLASTGASGSAEVGIYRLQVTATPIPDDAAPVS